MGVRRGPGRRLLALTLLLSGGCGPLPLESAYDSQRDICGVDAEVFAELMEDCRARWEQDRSCAGVLGFRGTLEGVEVTVESSLVQTRLVDLETLAGPVVREGVGLLGRSPYFEFDLTFESIGGEVEQPAAAPSVLEVGAGNDLEDAFVGASMRMSTGAESVDLKGVAGELTRTLQRLDEQAGTFDITFADGDSITGCFHGLVTERLVDIEENPGGP